MTRIPGCGDAAPQRSGTPTSSGALMSTSSCAPTTRLMSPMMPAEFVAVPSVRSATPYLPFRGLGPWRVRGAVKHSRLHDHLDPASPAGLTEQAAIVAIDQACRRLRLPTIRAVLDEVTAAANREQLSYQGLIAGRV